MMYGCFKACPSPSNTEVGLDYMLPLPLPSERGHDVTPQLTQHHPHSLEFLWVGFGTLFSHSVGEDFFFLHWDIKEWAGLNTAQCIRYIRIWGFGARLMAQTPNRGLFQPVNGFG